MRIPPPRCSSDLRLVGNRISFLRPNTSRWSILEEDERYILDTTIKMKSRVSIGQHRKRLLFVVPRLNPVYSQSPCICSPRLNPVYSATNRKKLYPFSYHIVSQCFLLASLLFSSLSSVQSAAHFFSCSELLPAAISAHNASRKRTACPRTAR